MKLKYLGTFTHEIDYNESNDVLNDIDEDIVMCWRDVNDFNNTYSDDFMRLDDDLFHGVMSETNTSAIMIKLLSDNESAKLYRAY